MPAPFESTIGAKKATPLFERAKNTCSLPEAPLLHTTFALPCGPRLICGLLAIGAELFERSSGVEKFEPAFAERLNMTSPMQLTQGALTKTRLIFLPASRAIWGALQLLPGLQKLTGAEKFTPSDDRLKNELKD